MVGLAVVLLAAAVAVVGSTFAILTDSARVNLAAGGVGFAHRFDLAVVLPDGTVAQADGPNGLLWQIDGADTLVPGHEVSTTIPVFNNTPNLAADTTMRVVLLGDDGAVGDAANITPFLRFTATSASGVELFRDVAWAKAHASLGVLAARGSAALASGATFSEGDPESLERVRLTVSYPDQDGTEDFNGGLSGFAVRFDAVSTGN